MWLTVSLGPRANSNSLIKNTLHAYFYTRAAAVVVLIISVRLSRRAAGEERCCCSTATFCRDVFTIVVFRRARNRFYTIFLFVVSRLRTYVTITRRVAREAIIIFARAVFLTTIKYRYRRRYNIIIVITIIKRANIMIGRWENLSSRTPPYTNNVSIKKW